MLPISNRLLQKKYSCKLKTIVQLRCNATSTTSNKSINKDKFKLPKTYAGSSESVWVQYAQLAVDYKPLNLGQGFSDYACPTYITDALADVAHSNNPLLQQYTRGFGHPRLTKCLSDIYSKKLNRTINPTTEILITIGAYEALFCAIMGHINEGDEVIIIEPFFDCYEPMVKAAGGITKFIPLRKSASCPEEPTSADYNLDTDELTGLFSARTKMILVNTPQNPFGKVFTETELTVIADLCKKWDVLCISDEVYEWVAFKPYEHISIATLPDMWERTITIGSAGKTFNITGWKTGWAFGPDYLLNNLFMVHQNCVYTCTTPIQEAIAIGFEHELPKMNTEESFFESLSKSLQEKRDLFAAVLKNAGFKPILPQAGFFILADWSPLKAKVKLEDEKDKYADYRFTKWMTKKLGLQGIPVSAFYSESNKKMGEHYVRYCYFKKNETLEKAAKILKEWKVKET